MFARPAGERHLKFMNETPNEGLIRIPGFFNQDWLFVTSTRGLGEVLVHKSYDFQKPRPIRNFLRTILGDGLIIVEGDEHKFQRKHLTPAFSFRHIKELYPIFWAKATELVRCVTAEVKEKASPTSSTDEKLASSQAVVEINHWANKVTMDIIGLAGLGRNFQALQNSNDELINNYEEVLEPSTEKAAYFTANVILSRRVVLMLPWKLNETLKRTTSTLRNICGQLVREKKALTKAQPAEQVDILSLLIKSNNFADDMLIDQLLTFLAAG